MQRLVSDNWEPTFNGGSMYSKILDGPRTGSKFFQFHAVFGKLLTPPPRGNPRSATDIVILVWRKLFVYFSGCTKLEAEFILNELTWKFIQFPTTICTIIYWHSCAETVWNWKNLDPRWRVPGLPPTPWSARKGLLSIVLVEPRSTVIYIWTAVL